MKNLLEIEYMHTNENPEHDMINKDGDFIISDTVCHSIKIKGQESYLNFQTANNYICGDYDNPSSDFSLYSDDSSEDVNDIYENDLSDLSEVEYSDYEISSRLTLKEYNYIREKILDLEIKINKDYEEIIEERFKKNKVISS